MPFLSVTREFKFCAAHRLIHHPGRCRYLHGHSYRAEVEVGLVMSLLTSDGVPDLGKSGMVADFADVKAEVGGWINQNWDHNTILNSNDPLLWVNGSVTDPGTPENEYVVERRFGRRPFVLAGEDPTAERLAMILLAREWDFARNGKTPGRTVKVVSVRVWETDSCSATASE